MKKLANLKPGAYFFYGGVQWVVLENNDKIGATLSIAAEPVFNRAFDEENRNDWRVSSLRRELNGPFFDALIAEGANRAAFLDWESDLTADNGMTDYGTATDKIALLSDGLYRKYRQFIPLVDDWCWTLTPWTCNPSDSCGVRGVYSSGAVGWYGACGGGGGARPLCYLESSIPTSITRFSGLCFARNRQTAFSSSVASITEISDSVNSSESEMKYRNIGRIRSISASSSAVSGLSVSPGSRPITAVPCSTSSPAERESHQPGLFRSVACGQASQSVAAHPAQNRF